FGDPEQTDRVAGEAVRRRGRGDDRLDRQVQHGQQPATGPQQHRPPEQVGSSGRGGHHPRPPAALDPAAPREVGRTNPSRPTATKWMSVRTSSPLRRSTTTSVVALDYCARSGFAPGGTMAGNPERRIALLEAAVEV